MSERESLFPCKIGELARRTGVSVRTLHYYDEIGLLVPTAHSDAGHRYYSVRDLVRLQQILSLRALGLGLDDVRRALSAPDFSPAATLALQLQKLDEELAAKQALRAQLIRLQDYVAHGQAASPQEFLSLIRIMNMSQNHFTPKQMQTIDRQRQLLGEAGMRAAEAEWPQLIAAMQQHQATGTPPSDPEVQRLAGRWRALVDAFTGGDPEIEKSLRKMYQDDAAPQACIPGMKDLMAYVQAAWDARARE